MCALEQTIDKISLGFVEKKLLSEITKIKRREGQILPHRRISYRIFRECEEAYSQILGSILQLYEYQKPF